MALWLCASPFFLLAFGQPAFAQQAAAPAVTQQPFGQKLPPPPQQQQQQPTDPARPDPKHRPGWMYRGMVAVAVDAEMAPDIEAPVTGFGNEALWDAPPPLSRPVQHATPPVVAARHKRR